MNNLSDSAESLLLKTFFIVEATSFEQLCLWQQHSNESVYSVFDQVTWKQIWGWQVTVGELDNRPIAMTLSFVEINRKLVCFYDPCSQLVDNKLIETWFDQRFFGKWDSGTRSAKTDAMNFHHCINAIKDS
jgi:hypothetical protein